MCPTCRAWAHITTCHLQYIATQTSLGLHLCNEQTHYHLLHTLHCHICYITAQSFLQQMHTYNFGIVHICTCHTRLTSVCMYTFFCCCHFWEKWTWQGHILRWNKLSGAHDGQCRHSRPAKASTPLHQGDCDALSLWRDISTPCHFISSNFPWNWSNPFLMSNDI